MRIIKDCRQHFKFAPEHCETAAFWLGGHPPGWTEFLERCEHSRCQFHRYDDSDDHWQRVQPLGDSPPQGLYQLTPCVEELRFVYIHTNPGDSTGVEHRVVPGKIKGMLQLMVRAGCRIIAIANITGPGGDHQAGKENSQAIINTVSGCGDLLQNADNLYLVYPPGWFDAD